MAQNELDPRKQVATIRDLLNKSKGQIALALPKHMSPDRMLRMAMTSIQKNPRLMECTIPSLIGGVIQSAQLGLELDDVLGQAYLVPFRNNKKQITEAQFMVGYKGLTKLATNTRLVKKIEPRAVYEGDEFEYAYGTDPYIKHKPAPSKNRGKLTHAYAVASLSSGTQFVVLDRDEIDEHRAKSKSSGGDSPWNTNYDSMAMKTAIRVLSKYVPAAAELQMAASLDERAEEGISQDLEAIYEEIIGEGDGRPPQNTQNMSQLTDRLKQEQQGEPKETKPEQPKAEETKPPQGGKRLF